MDELLKVPGIGSYTAGAILSLAFNQKAPIVDGNVLRVFARLYAIPDPINEEKTKACIYKLQSGLVPFKNPGQFNEALMELGALVCTPSSPLCTACPVKRHCLAFKKNTVGQLPKKTKLKKITKVEACAVILERKGMYFIHRRPDGQIMGGLWEFPEWKMKDGTRSKEERQKSLLSQKLSIPRQSFSFLKRIKRHYTRFSEDLSVYAAEVPKTPSCLENQWDQNKWVRAAHLKNFPFTSAHAKIRSLILES